MGIFNRNPNESAYIGGKKHWADVIKNSGDGSLLVWRQPEEDFNTNSTLIVMPGEEAVFIKGGVIEQVFTNGTYKLSTENYPVISRLRNAFTGGVSTFNCVVYFVRVAHSREIEWGTMSPIQYYDDTFGNLNVKSYGAYKVCVENAGLFLQKMLGNNVDYETPAGLNKYFANEFQMHIVNALSRAIDSIKSEGKVVFEAVRNTVYLAQSAEPFIKEILSGYGLKLQSFSVASCKIESSDPEIQKMITDRARMNYLGSGWAAQQQVDIMKDLASNPNGGGVAAAGAGMGMGIASGGVFAEVAKNTLKPSINNPLQPQYQSLDIKQNLLQLKELLDLGLISQEDFEAKKAELLAKM